MGNITTTKKEMDDTMDFAVVRFDIGPADDTHNTLAKRVRVYTEYRFDAPGTPNGFIGSSNGDRSAPAYLVDHPALDATQRTTLLQLIKAIYDSDTAADPLA